MSKLLIFRSKVVYAAHFCLFIIVAICSAQENKVMGEVRFEGSTKVEKHQACGSMATMWDSSRSCSLKNHRAFETWFRPCNRRKSCLCQTCPAVIQ